MHFILFDPIGNQKFENPRLWTAAILKIEKNMISRISNFGGVDLASRP